MESRDYQGLSNAPDRIRTCDLRFRRFHVTEEPGERLAREAAEEPGNTRGHLVSHGGVVPQHSWW
jgi:hypothetical protein